MNRPDRDSHITVDPTVYRKKKLEDNPLYNEVGFGDSYKMTATDKLALNFLLSCPTIKKKVYEEYLQEEINRNYIELMTLTINPTVRSER